MARGEFYCKEITGFLFLEECYKCKTQFAMSKNLHDLALERREEMSFFCPNGHPQQYHSGESDIDKMRRERDRLTQRLAEKDDEIKHQRELREATERQLSASRGQVTKIRNRAAAGVCPCCNRTFSQLARHMASKHPAFRAETVN